MKSAEAADASSAWSVRVWKTEEGLRGNDVSAVCETPDGFLWAVGGSKLSRFDGVRWESFSPPEFSIDPDRSVRTARRLKNGDLAFLMHSGAFIRLGPGRSEIINVDIPRQRPESIVESEQGELFAIYAGGHVYRVKDGKFHPLTAKDGLPAGRTRFVATNDNEGRIWFSKEGQVGIYRHGRFETLTQVSSANVRLAGARDGGIWICSRLQLLRFREGESMREAGQIPVTQSEAQPTAILEDKAGAVWVGTSTSGLFRYDGASFESVAISHREVFNLTEDRENNLWVGTSGGGLNQVQPRAIRVEGEETGVPFRAVQAICEDRDGRLWAVTQDGTFVTRTNGSWRNVLPGGESLNAEASCIAADPSGAIWIGTRQHRLFRWRDGQLDSWGAAEGLVCSTVRALIVSRAGDLWVAGSGPAALQRLRGETLQAFPLPEGTRAINALAEDVGQHIWAGGASSGLIRVDPQDRLSTEGSAADTQRFQIRALHSTADGTLWISYDQGGVGRLKNGALKRLTTQEGLIDDNLRLVISDQHGWLWFAAVSHVFKIRESELHAVAEGRLSRVQPIRYGRDQGLHVVLGGTVGALLARDGRLWLPLATSLAVIDPELQERTVPAPPVFVTRVTVDESVIASHGGVLSPPFGAAIGRNSLQLEPAHRRLNIDFTAPSFSAPESIRFQHRLEDFDDAWIDAGTERRATYSRLAAGRYRFQVRASSSESAWSDAGTDLTFEVIPFFWETWWFRGLALAAFTAIIAVIARSLFLRRLRMKVRSLEQQTALERERARIARDIHDDLGSRLTKIVLLSGLIRRETTIPQKSHARIDEISETARQLMKSLDETVWLVSPRNDTLPHLVSYLSQYAVKFLRTAEIACHVDLPDDPPDYVVPSDTRHHLLLVLKEALNNIVRHAHATDVRLRIRLENGRLLIELADNGDGFSPAKSDEGADGLINMQQRMKQIGGEFRLHSQPGSGTEIRLTAPCSAREL